MIRLTCGVGLAFAGCLLPRVELIDEAPGAGGRGGSSSGGAGGISKATGGTSFTGGAGGTGKGGAGGIGATAPFRTCPADHSVGPMLFDDFEDGDNATRREILPHRGYWYSYNDKSGTQTPPAESSIPFVATAPGAGKSGFAGCTQGTGFTDWGAGIGFYVIDIDGSTFCPVNVGKTQGLRFNFKGTGNVRLNVPRRATSSPANGGICSGDGCDYSAFAPITPSAGWTRVSIGWNQLSDGARPFSPEDVLGFQFQAYDPEFPDGPPINFQFCVDDVELY